MTDVWCVRAEGGLYTEHFVRGGYVAIGWIGGTDLSEVQTKEDLYPLYLREHSQDTSSIVIGQQVGQVARFILDIKAGDYVITPAPNSDLLYYGEVLANPSYVHAAGDDGCPYRQRRRVEWAKERLKRSQLSIPLQNTLRALLTVFSVSQREEFLEAIGEAPEEKHRAPEYDPYRSVLKQVLELDAKEFEILVGHLLTALGFEAASVIGRPGDGGVDATGELNASGLAKIKVFVQAKRYKLGAKVSASAVRQLRQAIPFGGQGAFITTADYQGKASDVAIEPGFPRIGLINGRQLVDLLVEHWNDIPQEFQERLGLKPGLVRA